MLIVISFQLKKLCQRTIYIKEPKAFGQRFIDIFWLSRFDWLTRAASAGNSRTRRGAAVNRAKKRCRAGPRNALKPAAAAALRKNQVGSTYHVLRGPSAITKTINRGSDRRTGSLDRGR